MFISTNPATGQAGETYAELSDAEIEVKLATAQRAYRSWRAATVEERTALLQSETAARIAEAQAEMAATSSSSPDEQG